MRIIRSSFGIINVVSEFMRILLCVSAYLPAIQTIKKTRKNNHHLMAETENLSIMLN